MYTYVFLNDSWKTDDRYGNSQTYNKKIKIQPF